MEKEFLNSVYKRLNNMEWTSLKEDIRNRDVYIWGADEKGKTFSAIFESHGIKICGFLDSNPKIQCDNVLPPQKIIYQGSREKNYVIVSMLLRYCDSVLEQLRDNGFEEKDYFYPCNEWSFLGYEWSFKNIDEYEKLLKYGKQLAESLEENNFYFLLTGGHIGDSILALSFLYAVRKKMRLKSLTVITSEKYEGLVKLYPDDVDKIICMDENQLEALRVYSKSETKEHYNIIGADWKFMSKERKVPYPIAQVLYKTKHLGLDYDVKSKYIKGFGWTDTRFRNYIDTTGIEEGKSIILIPYAQSAGMLPVSFWEELAIQLSAKYSVYTNVGPGESAIKGTTPLFIPFEYVVDTIKYAGKAISIRCGLTDLIALGQCDCMVLYSVKNQMEENYSRVTSLYVNGEESILLKNAKYIAHNQKNADVIKEIMEAL